MIFSQSFTVRNWGLGMVWDDHTKTHTKPLVDKREHGMEFHTGTTKTRSIFEGQRRFMLGQAMDLIPWCGLLVYALYYNGIMVTNCCL